MSYFKHIWGELKKVIWPDKNTTVLYTIVVVLISLFVAYYLGLFDYIFTNFGLRSLLR